MTLALVTTSSLVEGKGKPGGGGGGGKTPSLNVSLNPSSIEEGESAIATVTRSNSDVVVDVSLGSNDLTQASVNAPATVTLAVGDTTATFTVLGLDDGIPDGDQTVAITASAEGYQSGSANLTVTDPPPVQYSIDIIPTPSNGTVWMNGITNNSVVYGWYADGENYRSGFVYDQVSGVFYDLNLETSLLQQVEDLFGEGWRFASIIGMNDAGHLTGSVNDGTAARKGFVIDTSLDGEFSPDPANWLLRILPDFGSSYTFGKRINEHGDILGVYQREDGTYDYYIYNPWLDTSEAPMPALELGVSTQSANPVFNNFAQVAAVDQNGVAFTFDPATSQFRFFSEVEYRSITGLNDNGSFAGDADIVETNTRGKKEQRVHVAFRHTGVFEQIANARYAVGINSSGDVAAQIDNGILEASVSHTGFAPDFVEQNLVLSDLIDDNDLLKETFVTHQTESFAINDRDGTGFSQVVVRLYDVLQSDGTTARNVGVILTPITPSP